MPYHRPWSFRGKRFSVIQHDHYQLHFHRIAAGSVAVAALMPTPRIPHLAWKETSRAKRSDSPNASSPVSIGRVACAFLCRAQHRARVPRPFAVSRLPFPFPRPWAEAASSCDQGAVAAPRSGGACRICRQIQTKTARPRPSLLRNQKGKDPQRWFAIMLKRPLPPREVHHDHHYYYPQYCHCHQ